MIKNYKHNYPLYDVTYSENFKQVLEDSIKKSEGRPAFRYRKGQDIIDVSYEEFYNDTKAVGTQLAALGLSDAHVAMVGPNSYKWVTVYLACLNGNNVFVPVDKELPINEMAHIIGESDAEIVFCADLYVERFKSVRDKLPKVKYFVNVEAKADDGEFLCYDSFIEKGHELLKNGDTSYTDITPVPEKLKMIVYTSGTTGTAKGVMLSLSNITNGVCYGLSVSTVYSTELAVLPFHHTYESVCGLLVSMKHASTICINENLRTILGNFKTFRPDYIMLVPLFVENFYKRIWATVEEQGKDKILRNTIKASNALLKIGIDMRRTLFKSIHEVFGGRLIKIVSGGAPIREELGRFFESIGITLINGYGITECSPLVSANRDFYYNFASVGNPLPCLELKIDDPNEDGEGEICVKGAVVMMGYYKNPEKTAEVLSEDGWFKTGDYGKIGEDGRLYITGRKKNLIVLKNGKNIYPEEIEEYLGGSDFVNEVIVSAIKNEDGEETGLQAEIYPHSDKIEGMSDEQIYDKIKAEVERINSGLPSHKRVIKVHVRKEPFEKTTSGKIRRKY